MPYFIQKNGQTLGPLWSHEVLEHSDPDTLISHGREWFRFDQHPHFSHLTEFSSSTPQPHSNKLVQGQEIDPQMGQRQRVKGTGSDADRKYWILVPEIDSPQGPYSKRQLKKLKRPILKVSFGDSWVYFLEHPDLATEGVPPRQLDETKSRRLFLLSAFVACVALIASALLFLGLVR